MILSRIFYSNYTSLLGDFKFSVELQLLDFGVEEQKLFSNSLM